MNSLEQIPYVVEIVLNQLVFKIVNSLQGLISKLSEWLMLIRQSGASKTSYAILNKCVLLVSSCKPGLVFVTGGMYVRRLMIVYITSTHTD